MGKKLGIALLVLILLLAGAYAIRRFHSSFRGAHPAPKTSPGYSLPVVTVAPVRSANLTEELTLEGTVAARQTVNVQPQVAGEILSLPVSLGESVRPGQLLAEIDDSSVRAQLATAEAALGEARAKLAQVEAGTPPTQIAVDRANLAKAQTALATAKENYEDTKKEIGFEETIESSAKELTALQQTLDQAEEAYRNARAAYAAAEQVLEADLAPPQPSVVEEARAAVVQAEDQVAALRTQDALYVIRSPIAGTITALPVSVGSTASPAGSLMTIQGSGLEVDATVPQADLARVRPGDPVSITPITGGRSTDGRVEVVNPAGNSATLSFTAIIVPNASSGLLPGEAVTVAVTVRRIRGALVIPAAAVNEENGTPQAYLVKNGRVRLVNLRLGLQEGSLDQVLSGLRAGDLVVTSGETYLATGDRVRIAPATRP